MQSKSFPLQSTVKKKDWHKPVLFYYFGENFMFPCCWFTAILALLASVGISFLKPSGEFIIYEILLVIGTCIILNLNKARKKKSKCCSKSIK